MTSSKSPRDVFILAWQLGCRCLPEYSSFFSRKDFTLPQLFACLVLRHFFDISLRGVAELLADLPDWCEAIEMERAPNFRTISDAFDKVIQHGDFDKMINDLTQRFAECGVLDLDGKPLAIDSTCYESHHVSRHYEKRKLKTEQAKKDGKHADKQGSFTRSATVRRLPKLAIAVVASCHFVLAAWAGTGMGSDHPHFDDLLLDSWTRADVKCVVADAGYDSEENHRVANLDMGIRSIIPPLIGRPSESGPTTQYRAEMAWAFADESVKAAYGQRWQVETVNSMMKRNYGSSLRAAKSERREREMKLKAVVHNLALLATLSPPP